MTLPPDYPHNMTDENLEQYVRFLTTQLSTTDMGTVMTRAPVVQVGQIELQLRAVRALRDAIDDFKKASDKAAGRLVVATWVLVALTLGLLGATIGLIVTAS
jgi:hypothetical protein